MGINVTPSGASSPLKVAATATETITSNSYNQTDPLSSYFSNITGLNPNSINLAGAGYIFTANVDIESLDYISPGNLSFGAQVKSNGNIPANANNGTVYLNLYYSTVDSEWKVQRYLSADAYFNSMNINAYIITEEV